MQKCSNCNGTGRIVIGCGYSADTTECPVCNGKGYTGTDENK